MGKFILILAMIFIFGMPAFAVSYLTTGYENSLGQIRPFAGTPALFNLATTNLQTADRTAAVAEATLTGDIAQCAKPYVSLSTQIVILNHKTTFALTPGSGTAPFPMIWVKKSYTNSDYHKAGKSFSDPYDLFVGPNLMYLHQKGFTIQAPYYDWMEPGTNAAVNWQVFVYADKDIISGTKPALGQGRILDPRLATLRWFAWAGGTDQTGMPAHQWKMNTFDGTTVGSAEFNTLPLINSTTPAIIKAYLKGLNYAEETLGDLENYTTSLATGEAGYNKGPRMTPIHSNNFRAVRHNVGLVYVAPPRYGARTDPELTRFRTQILHMQFIAYWPIMGVPGINNSCDINFYQRLENL